MHHRHHLVAAGSDQIAQHGRKSLFVISDENAHKAQSRSFHACATKIPHFWRGDEMIRSIRGWGISHITAKATQSAQEISGWTKASPIAAA
jgi:hypothetical protein